MSSTTSSDAARLPRAADRLQGSLLDRLNERGEDGAAPPRYVPMAEWRRHLLRDLGWLFNATQPMQPDEAAAHPQAAASVLNFGLPPLAGALASRVDVVRLEREMLAAIQRFEPRIQPDTLAVRALRLGDARESHNVIEFEIQASAWARPVPLDLLLRTRLDLEGGEVEVREVARSAWAEARQERGR